MEEKKNTKKTARLGKGIGALFENVAADYEINNNSGLDFENSKEIDLSKVVMLKLRDIEPNPKQPRKTFDKEKLEALASSLKTHGMVQPILVQKRDNGMYTIIAGERRWRASKLANLTEVPCIIKEFDEKELMEIALIENLQREDLNPIEEAEGYKNLMEKFSMTQEEVAQRVGKSRSAVANSLRLNNLCPEIKELVVEGKLSQGHARTILPIENKNDQLEIAEKIIKEGLNVRQTEKLVNSYFVVEKETPPQIKEDNSDMLKYYSSLENTLSKKFNTKVKILPGKTKSRIEIEYYSNEDLERLLYELKK